jgi:peptidoglycan/LPS O-acetylase OafA/YrhL
VEFKSAKSHRFHLLDALRGIAALLVALRHAPAQLLQMIPVYNSYLAVDFFFCLSGFVIAYSYEDRLGTRMNLRDFMAARVIRLYPLAALGTLIVLLFMAATGHITKFDSPAHLLILFVLSFLSLPNFSALQSGILYPFNSPAWSLFFEMLANLAYACLIRFRLAKTWVLGTISFLSLGLLILSLSWRSDFNGGTTRGTAYLGLARVGYSFFVGVCLFRLHRRGRWKPIQGSRALLASFAIVVIMIAALTVETTFTKSATFNLLATAGLFPLVIHIASKIDLGGWWVAPCAFLGDMSYPLYITHVPLLGPLASQKTAPLLSAHSTILPFATFFLFLFLACLAVWLAKHFDEPVRRFLTAKYNALNNRQPRPATVV